jgi:hypothetical protein
LFYIGMSAIGMSIAWRQDTGVQGMQSQSLRFAGLAVFLRTMRIDYQR